MGWVKLDDGFFRNPKAVGAGRDARLLYLAGLCYCGSNLTDGMVPHGALRVLAAEAEITRPVVAASRLVSLGLWEDAEGGYRVHNYLEYNRSSDSVRGERDAAADRMKRRRSENVRPNISRSSAEVRELDTDTDTDTDTEGGTPPVPPECNAAEPPAKVPDYPPDFEAFWSAYPTGHGSKKQSGAQWHRIRPGPDLRSEIHDGLDRWKLSDRWGRGFVVDAQRWLRDRGWEDIPPPTMPTLVTTPNGKDIGVSTQDIIAIARGERVV